MEFQVTSREFNRNSAKIREESLHKPVIITVRGEPTNVLLSYKEYVRVFKSSDNRKTATELFAHKKPLIAISSPNWCVIRNWSKHRSLTNVPSRYERCLRKQKACNQQC